MKIIYKTGDVTEAIEPAILHGCNAQGVMGSGVALAIRQKFPSAYMAYRGRYAGLGLPLGKIVAFRTEGKHIWNGITQFHYGAFKRQVNYEAIFTVLEEANRFAVQGQIGAVAMPRIGAGLGGGKWRIIEAMIEETSTDYQPIVYDYEP